MAKKIIILSDGTGNAASSVWRTNVWRIFQSLKLEGHEQAARYDDGVGTSSFKPLAVLGGAFGYGLKRNVLESYKFICRNYEEHNPATGTGPSKLYLFGFSRGAFTVRVLSSLILQQGLVRTQSDGELHDLARKAYRAYRAHGYTSYLGLEKPARFLRDALVWLFDKATGRRTYDPTKNIVLPAIEFIGVWDTVAAYGLPADEMTRGVSDWLWPLELPNRVLSPKILCARHALALDDERTTFHPVLWTEADEKKQPPNASYSIQDERLVQVWFTGMHSNVGGGYPDDALAFTPLYWLMREARARGLVFKEGTEADPDTEKWMKAGRDPDGRLYDSRIGLGGYYRYGPRKVFDLCNDMRNDVKIERPKIHESVFARIDSGCNSYAPIGIPQEYVVVRDDGTVLPMYPAPAPNARPTYETQADAAARAIGQDRLWNYVWMRRIVYFLTLAATFNLVFFSMIYTTKPAREFESPIRLVSEALRALQKVIPGWARGFVDHYAANPMTFVVSVAALVGLLIGGAVLSGKIKDSMRTVWCSRGSATVASSPGHLWLQKFRTSSGYQGVIALFKFWILPALFALLVVFLAVTGIFHIAFNVADSLGAYCEPSEKPVQANLGIAQRAATEFETKSLCAPTGLTVREGFRYEIVMTVTEPWRDGDIATTPVGYRSGTQHPVQAWSMRLVVLLRRIIARPWFNTIARIGDKGVDEYFLDPVRVRGSDNAWRDEFVARRSGEVFLYVNQSVLPVFSDLFYRNNRGKALVTVRLCASDRCRP
jgi:uncharacterized protein (DUF2235 family)